LSWSLSRYSDPGRSWWVSPVPRSVISPSPETMNTASMWLAYQNLFTVPAFSTVSCTEKPTLSLASTMRLLRQFSVSTSASVPVMSSRWRTIKLVLLLLVGSAEYRVHRGTQDLQALIDLGIGHGQRWQQLDDLALWTGGLHQHAALERFPAHLARQVTALVTFPHFDAAGQAFALGDQARLGVGLGDLGERGTDPLTLGLGGLLQLVGPPEQVQRLGGGDESRADAAERTVVLAGFPHGEPGQAQRERHRDAVAADRLGQADDVRLDACFLEAEERPGAAAAHLHVVDDQQDLVPLAQLGQRPQPLGSRRVDAALALQRLHDHRGRLVQPAAGVLQQLLQVEEVRELAVEVVVIG